MAWDSEDLVVGPVPLWFQIAERLRTCVHKGEFRTGQALPSEAALNRRFGVSRTTARAALDSLEQEGLITRRSGRGSIVAPARVDVPLNLMASFAEDMRARGLEPAYADLHVDVVPCESVAARALGLHTPVPAVRVDRLLLADGSAIGVSTSWLDPRIVDVEEPPTADDVLCDGLYGWLERVVGVRMTRGSEVIEASVATGEVARRLGLAEGAAVLTARRTAHDLAGRPVEHVCRHYRGDRYRYLVESVRP